MAERFTPKAVETIQDTLGLTLTQEQIDRGHVEFPIKSRWSWKNNPANAIIFRCRSDGWYTVMVSVNPTYGRVYTDFYKRVKAVPQLAKACQLLKDY